MKNNEIKDIDLEKVFKVIWAKRKVFLKLWAVVFVLSCVWILPQPRYFRCEVQMAPESNNLDTKGLSGIASSFGINLGSFASNDAISPILYPNVFKSPDFIVDLLGIEVTKMNNESLDYYTYRKNYYKHNPYTYPIKLLLEWVSSLKSKENGGVPAIYSFQTNSKTGLNPFHLSKEDTELIKSISEDITCTIDKKTNLITISIEDQDPLVCALMADSIKTHLQNYITTYRTQKFREDATYFRELLKEAEANYHDALATYSNYTDSHTKMTRQEQISEAQRLQNEVSLKLSAYNTLSSQLIAAEAKIQEHTPVFTTIKTATIPAKPAGPKRKIFIVSILFLATSIYAIWLSRKELFNFQ